MEDDVHAQEDIEVAEDRRLGDNNTNDSDCVGKREVHQVGEARAGASRVPHLDLADRDESQLLGQSGGHAH